MKNFNNWLSENPSKLPWVIIGKGPTFEKIHTVDLSAYQTIALNHTIVEIKSDIFHMIDLDVLDGIEEHVEKNAKFILMPFYPNVNNESGEYSLDQLTISHLFLEKMNNEGRLLWYNSSQSKVHKLGYPVITVKYFSADAVVSLLVAAGITTIWSIGLDGGVQYNKSFSHLDDKTLLSNGRESFNAQFIAIANTLEKNNAKLIPLGEKTIRVFVGTEVDQWLATKVLAFSIKLRTSASVEVFPLYLSNIEIPVPKDKKNYPRTPFSFQRFLIPELCEFQGRAIYLDSDMQVFDDIRGLANRDMKGQDLLNVWEVSDNSRCPQFSVMLMNCVLLNWDVKHIIAKLDKGELTYEELMHEMKIVENGDAVAVLEKEWNSLEYFEQEKTKLIHYTDMDKQPWLFRHNPYASVWIKELAEAIRYGYLTKADIKREILLGNIRPTLLYQLRTQIFDPQKIPKTVVWIDRLFKPPHQQKRVFWKNSTSKRLRGMLSYRLAKMYSLSKKIVRSPHD